ncbi:hypothetical protein Slin14017_G000730 [Septoria linicola]|nr:hypothetical protein Slin14017_G000730 [Septoria linicola]
MNHYYCDVSVYNRTSADLLLVDSSASQGEYDSGSPPNTITAGGNALIVLKDKLGFEGSAGKCSYEVYLPSDLDNSVSFELDYGDPTGWSNNWCGVKTNSDKLICNLHPYNTSGHPLTAVVENIDKSTTVFATMDIPEALHSPAPVEDQPAEALSVDQSIGTSAQSDNILEIPPDFKNVPVTAMFKIGFHSSIDPLKATWEKFPPVHETIAIAAFVQSHKHFPRGTTYANLNDEQWEYMRGVVWNDDPQCLLFDDEQSTNHQFSKGLAYSATFEGGNGEGNMTRRSHFHDLQFLHAMAPSKGATAQSTKDQLMLWLKTMYKLACGNQGVQASDSLSSVFGDQYFNTNTEPNGGQSIQELVLAPSTHFTKLDIQKRALGVCLHIIQDSYAVGHTKRKVLNPEDSDTAAASGFLAFKAGTYGRFGEIETFHTYSGQDDTRRGHYDEIPGGLANLPKANNIDSFNTIIGARDAVDKSKTLINFWAANTIWENGVEQFLSDDVFKLDPNATVGDTSVDT